MFLVDTSVWINLFNSRSKHHIPVQHIPYLATCPPVIQEVLQGVSNTNAQAKLQVGLMALHCFPESLNVTTFLSAADIFRTGRKRGLTIRSSVDCVIAAIAIEHKLVVWHLDRDFDQIATFTQLKTCKTLPR